MGIRILLTINILLLFIACSQQGMDATVNGPINLSISRPIGSTPYDSVIITAEGTDFWKERRIKNSGAGNILFKDVPLGLIRVYVDCITASGITVYDGANEQNLFKDHVNSIPIFLKSLLVAKSINKIKETEFHDDPNVISGFWDMASTQSIAFISNGADAMVDIHATWGDDGLYILANIRDDDFKSEVIDICPFELEWNTDALIFYISDGNNDVFMNNFPQANFYRIQIKVGEQNTADNNIRVDHFIKGVADSANGLVGRIGDIGNVSDVIFPKVVTDDQRKRVEFLLKKSALAHFGDSQDRFAIAIRYKDRDGVADRTSLDWNNIEHNTPVANHDCWGNLELRE